MANTYYTSLSGMVAASYGLQNTSNNVSNMQTPGFKRTDVFYSSLGNGGSDLMGSGVQVKGSKTNFCDGTYLGTNNPTDLAIVGQGFFVIKLNNNEYAYTRDGQFGFNSEGILIDQRSGGEVQGYDNAGNLVPIQQRGPKTSPGKASREIFLEGQFVLTEKSEAERNEPGPSNSKYQNIKFEVDKVYDAKGKSHSIQLEFKSMYEATDSDNGKKWVLVNLICDGQTITPTEEQTILFSSYNSGADEEKNKIQFKLNGTQDIILKFGNYMDGSSKGVELKESKLNPEGTKINILQNDGYGVGKQLSLSFDENGQIIYRYDNGQTIKGIYVGLARFENLDLQLIPLHDSLFKAQDESDAQFGRANEEGFGTIQSQKIETSNVDSTMEFANIVVLQRMFQACSQIMNIDKQLLEELAAKS